MRGRKGGRQAQGRSKAALCFATQQEEAVRASDLVTQVDHQKEGEKRQLVVDELDRRRRMHVGCKLCAGAGGWLSKYLEDAKREIHRSWALVEADRAPGSDVRARRSNTRLSDRQHNSWGLSIREKPCGTRKSSAGTRYMAACPT